MIHQFPVSVIQAIRDQIDVDIQSVAFRTQSQFSVDDLFSRTHSENKPGNKNFVKKYFHEEKVGKAHKNSHKNPRIVQNVKKQNQNHKKT